MWSSKVQGLSFTSNICKYRYSVLNSITITTKRYHRFVIWRSDREKGYALFGKCMTGCERWLYWCTWRDSVSLAKVMWTVQVHVVIHYLLRTVAQCQFRYPLSFDSYQVTINCCNHRNNGIKLLFAWFRRQFEWKFGFNNVFC